ncbi:MAG: hypothetical protein L0I91_11305, partial [Yaniella sp.]|nr:hypothetical protein [Yaniella sp.]
RLQATLSIMGNSQQVVATGWHKIAILGGWIATFLLAAWILVPRLIIGTAVPIALALTILLPIILLAIGCTALGVPISRGQSPSGRAVAWLWFSFLNAFVVGLFFPDDTIFSATSHEQATALIAVLFGPGWEGAGSAIANPAAIIMIISGIIAAAFAVLDSREGGPIRTDDEDHFQGHGYFAILGEDEYYRREK